MRRVLMSWLLSPLGFVGLFLLLFSFQSMAESEPLAFETLDMRPDQPPSWSGRHLSAPIVSLFRGTDYMYAERTFRIETTPAHGYLDIFYVRSGFQKKFEQEYTKLFGRRVMGMQIEIVVWAVNTFTPLPKIKKEPELTEIKRVSNKNNCIVKYKIRIQNVIRR